MSSMAGDKTLPLKNVLISHVLILRDNDRICYRDCSFTEASELKTVILWNTFFSSNTTIQPVSLNANPTHLIISNLPRQNPNNVSLLPPLYVSALQSASTSPSASLLVFSFFLPVSLSVCLPPCLHFIYRKDEISTCSMFSLPALHCVCQTHRLYPQCLTATPVC